MVTQCEEHQGECTTEEKRATYNGETKQATIHYMANAIFDPLITDAFGDRYSGIRLKLSRGFTKNGVIYIRKNTWVGLKKLIKHEFGHLFGFDHTWNVTLMNPTWVFRWLNRPKIELE